MKKKLLATIGLAALIGGSGAVFQQANAGYSTGFCAPQIRRSDQQTCVSVGTRNVDPYVGLVLSEVNGIRYEGYRVEDQGSSYYVGIDLGERGLNINIPKPTGPIGPGVVPISLVMNLVDNATSSASGTVATTYAVVGNAVWTASGIVGREAGGIRYEGYKFEDRDTYYYLGLDLGDRGLNINIPKPSGPIGPGVKPPLPALLK